MPCGVGLEWFVKIQEGDLVGVAFIWVESRSKFSVEKKVARSCTTFYAVIHIIWIANRFAEVNSVLR